MSYLDHTPALTDLHCLSGDTNDALAGLPTMGGHITEYELCSFMVPCILYSERRGDKAKVSTRGNRSTQPDDNVGYLVPVAEQRGVARRKWAAIRTDKARRQEDFLTVERTLKSLVLVALRIMASRGLCAQLSTSPFNATC
jgi:hypothetical protein